ncbi:hypothetical protein GOP47_0019765 [Adiantum capillus-veneris]|uniref:Peroxidase n=1 Tax=Adiantum capillus-veneris TaxID=13818 RepID=A0A9D4UC54_ADICA|nr:hypothetical protein GOP47_0019765 [Adiantum capillus-veneris]
MGTRSLGEHRRHQHCASETMKVIRQKVQPNGAGTQRSCKLQISASAGIVLIFAILASFSIGICPQFPTSSTSATSSSTLPFMSGPFPSDTASSSNYSLTEDFYAILCPGLLNIVNETLTRAISRNASVAAGLLRLAFHDCFVQGCDGSVLLSPELEDGPNKNSLRGLEAINEVKQALESECPGMVSCADIVALAARHSVVQSGGPYYALGLGRRDGFIMNGSLASAELPKPDLNISSVLNHFSRKGFNETDVVSLLGAHTIGQTKCSNFGGRLCNQEGTGMADPRLNASLFLQLTTTCILDSPMINDVNGATASPCNSSQTTTVSLDFDTPTVFDNSFFKNVQQWRGVLNTDAALLDHPTTKALVQAYAENQDLFFEDFKRSMVKLSSLAVLTGVQGEIRRDCSLQN